uniref:Rapamycininsensitive companion of mTORlike [Saccoglossus kowalevskii] n=1 Tax=Lepeophtheirus salmonis TaxID=72036 RepID=A0A0K2V7N4_LEPSM
MASGYYYPPGRTNGGGRLYCGKRGNPNLRARFLENNNEDDELDLSEGSCVGENVIEALKYLSSKGGSKGKKLAYLNALVKVLLEQRKDSLEEDLSLGLRLKEIMLCLRIPLTHEAAEVRAATLRVFRYIVDRPCRVQDFLQINAHLLVSRCIDIDLDNRVERLQALRFIRKLLFSCPESFPSSLCRSLIAIAEGGVKENDRLLRISLAILCEISVLNSTVFILCQGVRALTNSLLDCSMPRMAEAMIGCLLRLFNNPKTRSMANINLGVVITPFTEFRYIHNWFSQKVPTPSEALEDKQMRFQCSQQAILSLLRSWPGLLQLCNLSSKNSPLKALIDILYLSNSEVRNLLIDLIYEMLYLRVPKSSSNVKEVLEDIDPSSPRENWQLKEGFVASEGFDILPRLSKARPNIRENHLSILLTCLMELNLPEALVNVLVSSSLVLSIKATVLLGELLHKTFILLPHETNYSNHCLPTLFAEVASSDPERANRASQAVSTLNRIHSIKKRGPTASSLFFYEILSVSERFPNGEGFIGVKLQNPGAWSQLLNKSADDRVNTAIKESGVLSPRLNWVDWQWDQITVVFQCPSDNFLKNLESSTNKQFLRKIFDFFKPSNGKFSKVELSRRESKEYGWVGIVFLDFLLKCGSGEGSRILDELLSDIHYYFKAVISAESAHDCLISPTKIASTACQYYFLFIGHLSRTQSGQGHLFRHLFLPSLAELLGMRSELYMKLIISSLDYSREWGSRALLQRALVDLPEETPRLYATRFLGILIRSKSANVAQWGISLLVQQLYDPSPIIYSTALELLDEACDDKMNLEAVICSFASQKNKFKERISKAKSLRWSLILTRFVGSSNGFKLLSHINLVEDEIKKWGSEYNLQYVKLVEELLNESFTLHQRDEDGTYGRRKYGPHTVKDLFIPPHLYGQLAISEEGLEILQRKDSAFWPMLQTIRLARMPDEDKAICTFKSAIWGICHVASSPGGARIVEQHGGIRRIVDIALSNEIYSLRGTAYYALSLVATNRVGANALSSLNWFSLRFGREENWPVLEDWFANQLYLLKERARTESEDVSNEDDDDSSSNYDDDNQKTLTPANIDSYFGSTSFGNTSSGKSKLTSLFRSLSLSDSSGERVLSRLSEGRQSLSKKIKKSLSRRSSTKSRRDSNVSGKTTSSVDTELLQAQSSSKRLSFSSEVCDEDGYSLTDHSPVKAESSSVNAGLENIDEEDPPGAAAATLSFFSEFQPPSSEAKNSSFIIDSASTSGISSEDSCKLVVTAPIVANISSAKLSPIPSLIDNSSNDGFIQPHARSGQRAFSESEALPIDVITMKSTDLQLGGGSVSSVCSIGSWTTENSGYRTIRGIHSRRRPLLSESEVDTETNSQNAELTGSANSDTYRRSSGGLIRRKDSWTHKSKSLDYRLTRLRKNNSSCVNHLISPDNQPISILTPTVQQQTSPVELVGGQEPQYRGIAVPSQITALFPFIVEQDSSDVGDHFPTSVTLSSISTRDSSNAFFGLELHTPYNCLSCYRLTYPCKSQSRSRSRTSSLTNPASERVSTESSTVSTGGSPSNLRKIVVTKGVIVDSTDSIISAMSSDQETATGKMRDNSVLGKVFQRKEVLKLIDSMMHFSTKTHEQGLLKMKQKFPNLFNDLCLYSEVSLLLSKYAYRLTSRRFIQELFIDLHYDDLYEEPAKILKIEDLENVREMMDDPGTSSDSKINS